MSNEQTTETVESAPTPPTETVEPAADPAVVLPDTHPLVKTLAAQKEELKSLRVKAKRADDYDEANKTETQRLQDQLDAVSKENEAMKLTVLRATVAAETNVPADLLSGTTVEEMTAAAVKLNEFRGNAVGEPDDKAKTTPAAATQGAQGLTVAGANGTSVDQLSEEDVKRLHAQGKHAEIEEARIAGRLSTLLGA